MKQALRLFGALAIGISAAIFTPIKVKAETLGDALVSAYNSSGLLDQNRALLRAADEDVAAAVAGLRPIIGWASDVTRNWSRPSQFASSGTAVSTQWSFGVSAELLLYDFGATRMQVDAAKESVLATRQALVSVEQQVLLRAVEAFMNVRRTTEFVALRQNNLRLIREELRAARDRFEVGEVTRTDVSLAEARLASAQSGLAAAQGDLARAIEEYRVAVGRAPGRLEPPRRSPPQTRSLAEAKAYAVRYHPDILQVQHQVAAADLSVLIAEAAKYPSVKMTGRVGATETFNSSQFSKGASVGVEASGPIYQGGRLNSLKRRAMAQRDSQRANLHLTQQRIEQSVGNAYAGLEAARAVRQAAEQQVRAAGVAFRGVREEAKLGARTTLDVLDAEQELLDARASLISAQVDEFIAAYGVLSATGQLTAEKLNLGVQRFDPAAYYNLVKDAPSALSRQGKQLDRVLKALGKE